MHSTAVRDGSCLGTKPSGSFATNPVERVWFLDQAVHDLESARAWYERQREGLGNEYLGAVDDALERVTAFSRAHPFSHRGTRRILLHRFPYALYYRELAEWVCSHLADEGGR